MKNTKKTKTRKGDFGYFSSEKKKAASDHSRAFFPAPYHLFCGLGCQRYKNDSMDGAYSCRLPSRM